MKRKNIFISVIESGLSISNRFLYFLTLGLGVIFVLLGLVATIVLCLANRAQSFSLYLFFLLLIALGLFVSYRGWVGQKAIKPIKANPSDKDWVVVRSYPTTFWNYVRRAFFNPKDMGIAAGIVLFYSCFLLVLLLDDSVDLPVNSGLILILILFLFWEVFVLMAHLKFWKTVWNEGPLMARLSDEGFSFIMPYNISEEDEVVLVGDDRFVYHGDGEIDTFFFDFLL